MMCINGGVITAGFDEKRPLSQPIEKRTHKHGALDIAGGTNIVIAPVSGQAKAYAIYANNWQKSEKPDILTIPWKDYFYDVFGAIVVLVEDKTQRLHIFAHFFSRTLFESSCPVRLTNYLESKNNSSHILSSDIVYLKKGTAIAHIGNGGYSTGPHCHWEIHHSATVLDDFENRINPMEYMR